MSMHYVQNNDRSSVGTYPEAIKKILSTLSKKKHTGV